MAQVFVNQLMRQLAPATKQMQNLAYGRGIRFVENRLLKFFREEFFQDPVALELEGGNQEARTQTVLPEGYGNLFSFLGFDKGMDVITPLVEKIQEKTKVVNNPTVELAGDQYVFSFPVRVPTMEEMEAAAPQPGGANDKWDSRPWIRVLEEGIPGFAFFLHSKKTLPPESNSRSTRGIQLKKSLRFGNVGKIRFISRLLAVLRRRLEEQR